VLLALFASRFGYLVWFSRIFVTLAEYRFICTTSWGNQALGMQRSFSFPYHKEGEKQSFCTKTIPLIVLEGHSHTKKRFVVTAELLVTFCPPPLSTAIPC